MQIRVCDICIANNKIERAVGKSSGNFYKNSIRVSADVCKEHKDYLKSMDSGDAVTQISDLHKKWDSKEKVRKEEKQ
jgi:hypothetical protein